MQDRGTADRQGRWQTRGRGTPRLLALFLYGKKTIFPLQTKKRERTERCDAQFKLNSNFFVPV